MAEETHPMVGWLNTSADVMEGIAIAKLLLIFARYLSNAWKKNKWAKTETLWSIRKSLFCNPRSYLVWHHNICTLPNLFFWVWIYPSRTGRQYPVSPQCRYTGLDCSYWTELNWIFNIFFPFRIWSSEKNQNHISDLMPWQQKVISISCLPPLSILTWSRWCVWSHSYIQVNTRFSAGPAGIYNKCLCGAEQLFPFQNAVKSP